jgi:hypothetical protein
VRGGKERSQKVRKVREQEGSEGCRVAQEREAMRGWAPEVMGAMAVREDGRMSSLVGKRVGEMKALWMGLVGICMCGRRRRTHGQLSRAIWARLSTISPAWGHFRPEG